MAKARGPRRRILSVPAMPGVIGAGVFWVASLRPSLLPRDWYVQAGIGAISAAVGYGVGVLIGWVVGLVLQRPIDPARRAQRLVAAVVIAIGLLALIPWWIWQEDQRELVDQAPGSLKDVVPMLLLAAVVFAILILIGRVIGHGLLRLDAWLTRRIPRWIAWVVTALVFVSAVVVLSRDVVFDRFVSWANATYSVSDAETPPGVQRPRSALVSGSPGSLVGWETLGGYGKSFVAQATTTDQLRDFFGAGTQVQEPIRVYAGLKSAGTADARADLVVQELERTGAEDRAVVVAWTSTGTGWV